MKYLKLYESFIKFKTFENFSLDNIFNQDPFDIKYSLPWKGQLSENDKFIDFFTKGNKEDWSKICISIENIIKENNVSFFTHVSLNDNLSTSSIKNAMNPKSSDRAETLEDKIKGRDRNINDKWGFYLSTYDEDEKTDWDTLHYMARASEDINSIFVYSINIKPGSKFLRSDYFDFKMISEMDEDSMNLVKSLGLSGVYSERPYGEDKLEPEFDEEGNLKMEFDEKGFRYVGKYYKHSSLEICVVDIDCIQSIKKDDELKKKCIQQMSKEPKYSTGAHSGNKILQ
jgi:hypothetical protein